MSKLYKKYPPELRQYIYIGTVDMEHTSANIKLSSGATMRLGGSKVTHDLYYAINREYVEWDQPGNITWEQLSRNPGLIMNVPLEHDGGKDADRFSVSFNLEEFKRHLGIL
tara:strand:- start:490 stop:822 length:333 start_codon:yes stop_codon:yes gene_type:complete